LNLKSELWNRVQNASQKIESHFPYLATLIEGTSISGKLTSLEMQSSWKPKLSMRRTYVDHQNGILKDITHSNLEQNWNNNNHTRREVD